MGADSLERNVVSICVKFSRQLLKPHGAIPKCGVRALILSDTKAPPCVCVRKLITPTCKEIISSVVQGRLASP